MAPKVEVSADKQVTSSETFEMLQARLRNVPLIGTVQAGTPVTAIQNQELLFRFLYP